MNPRVRAAKRLWTIAAAARPEIIGALAAETLHDATVEEVLGHAGDINVRTRIDYGRALRSLHRRGELGAEPEPVTEPRRRRRSEPTTEPEPEPEEPAPEAAPADCPHCGTGGAALILVRHFASGMRSVVCDADRGGCGASGGWRESDDEAVEAWGMR